MVNGNSLYVGRFRLFHEGYLEVTKSLLAEGGAHLVIAIGAAQISYSRDNPFTGEERVLMIESALKEEGLHSMADVVLIDESKATHENWVRLVESLCPPFSAVYSHSELARRLFRRAGYVAKPVPQFSTAEFSFASVVGRVLNNKAWEDLVPKAVAEFMEEHELDRRIKRLFSTRPFSYSSGIDN